MFKKILTAVLVAAMLVLPTAGVGPVREQAPVQAGDAERIALHGLLLAMLNQEASAFDPGDGELAWEGLYNALSLSAGLEGRRDEDTGELFLPEEAVLECAAALGMAPDLPLPASLEDRMTYDAAARGYLLVCGEDGLDHVRIDVQENTAQGLRLTGALVYEVDGADLVCFQADLQPQDNLLGWAVTGLRLVD